MNGIFLFFRVEKLIYENANKRAIDSKPTPKK